MSLIPQPQPGEPPEPFQDELVEEVSRQLVQVYQHQSRLVLDEEEIWRRETHRKAMTEHVRNLPPRVSGRFHFRQEVLDTRQLRRAVGLKAPVADAAANLIQHDAFAHLGLSPPSRLIIFGFACFPVRCFWWFGFFFFLFFIYL